MWLFKNIKGITPTPPKKNQLVCKINHDCLKPVKNDSNLVFWMKVMQFLQIFYNSMTKTIDDFLLIFFAPRLILAKYVMHDMFFFIPFCIFFHSNIFYDE